MSYVDSNLISGETVLYKTGLHWIVLLGPILLGAALGLPGLVMMLGAMFGPSGESNGMGAIGILLLIVGGVGLCLGFVGKQATEMAVTNRRIVIKTGLLRRRTFELLLTKVESIGVDEGLMGRMLGYGTVVVRGTGGTPEPFRTVEHPLEFRRQVQQQVENLSSKQSITGAYDYLGRTWATATRDFHWGAIRDMKFAPCNFSTDSEIWLHVGYRTFRDDKSFLIYRAHGVLEIAIVLRCRW